MFLLILFCVIIMLMLLLFVIMFVVVMFVVIVVTFWCVENAWLCVSCVWPNGGSVLDVGCVGYNVVLIVIIVVTCCYFVSYDHGELL